MEHGATAVTEHGDCSCRIRLESIEKRALGTLISTSLTSRSIALLELFRSEVGVSTTMGGSIFSTNLSGTLGWLTSTAPFTFISIRGQHMANMRIVLVWVIL
jgi:hypothetical protein